jgi:glycerol-3-phosphate acyltransferase PlsY
MSLGSIIGSLAILILLIILTVIYKFTDFIPLVYSLIATVLIIYQHRQNIDRLQTGKEKEFFGQDKRPDSKTNPT